MELESCSFCNSGSAFHPVTPPHSLPDLSVVLWPRVAFRHRDIRFGYWIDVLGSAGARGCV